MPDPAPADAAHVIVDSASKPFWDRVKEHGLAAVLLVAVLGMLGKVYLGNDSFLKEKLIQVIEKTNSINEASIEVDRQDIVATVRQSEELDDLTDTQREANKQFERNNSNIERLLGIVEAKQEIEAEASK